MGLSLILTTTLLTTLTSPDLCADVYVDANGVPYKDAVGQTFSRFCEWTGPNAAVLDRDVCCVLSGDAATCTLPDRKGRCSTGSKVYCKYGDATSTGAVVCQQPFPSICDFGFCGDVLPPDGGPLEDELCCWPNGACVEIMSGADASWCIGLDGISGYCENGVTNDDGTVDCFD
jgi:hypothetical protein